MKKEYKALLYLLKGDANSQEIVHDTCVTNTELNAMKRKGLVISNGRPRRGQRYIPATWTLTKKGYIIAGALLKDTTMLEYLGFILFGKFW